MRAFPGRLFAEPRAPRRGARKTAYSIFIVVAALSFGASFSSALESTSAGFRNTRSNMGAAGGAKTSISFQETDTLGSLALTTAAGAAFIVRSGLIPIYFYPGKISWVFASSGTAPGAVDLYWTAPGNDGYAPGTAAKSFVIKQSQDAGESPALSETKFNAAAAVTPAPPNPAVQGSVQSMTITGLVSGASGYFALKAREADGIPGVLSAGATAWAAISPPNIATPTFSAVSSAGFSLAWTSGTDAAGFNTPGTQYLAQLATAADFSGLLLSSQTLNLSAAFSGLDSNTTYYARAAAFGPVRATGFTVLGATSTLANPVSGPQFAGVFAASATLNWVGLPLSPPDASSKTAEGYLLQASTAADFTGTLFSSVTPNAALSTLTVSGLNESTTYYFRVGSLNWNSVPNYVAAGTTRTTTGLAPSNPIVAQVFLSSISVAWGSVASDDGYTLEASTTPDFSGAVLSSAAPHGTMTGLVVFGLDPNTTWYLRAGSVWSGATSYALTTPISTSTLANLAAGPQFAGVFITSVTMNWAGLPLSPPDASSKTAEGYLLQASIAADFSGALFSSSTPNAGLSTLTVSGLSEFTTYYFRLGALNWNSVPNYIAAGTTRTHNPVPTTTSISPSSATVGGAGFTLTVNGTNFVAGSVVRWDGADRATTFVNAGQLTAAIPAGDIASTGTAAVTVFNPSPGGGTSNAQTFTVNNPAPTTTSISPSSAIVGGAGFTLTVNGTNFVAGSVVRWDGADRATTFVSAGQLTAVIPAGAIASTGTAAVTVFNPAPGGGTSNAQTFAINNPVPTTTSISPASAIAGGAGFTLTVNGTNFVSGAVVRWNGADRVTTFVNAGQLTAVIPVGDLVAGAAAVTVFNPTQGGGTSNSQTFTSVYAAITPTINYQGFLTDKATGLPIDGTRDMQFRLCASAAASCAGALFSESRCASGGNGPAVGVAKGRYTVEVGSSTAGGIPASVFTANSSVWLEVLVDADGDCAGFEALSPRLRMQAAPYAFSALHASTATTLAANGANCAAGSFPLGVDASGAVESCSTSISGSAANVTGTVAVGNGGTGAADAAGARANLGVPSTTGSGANGTWGISITGSAGSGIPTGAVKFVNLAACPTGWTELVAARGRYLVGLASGGTLAGTVGTALSNLENRPVGQHSHAVSDPTHSHPAPSGMWGKWNDSTPSLGGPSQAQTAWQSAFTGISLGSTGAVGGTNAPYLQLLVCQKD